MCFPDHKSLMTLQPLSNDKQEHAIKKVHVDLADHFGLTADERANSCLQDVSKLKPKRASIVDSVREEYGYNYSIGVSSGIKTNSVDIENTTCNDGQHPSCIILPGVPVT